MKINSLASGSSGNCTYVESGRAKLLIDAGISCKKITNDLSDIGVDVKEISAVIITHEHVDHIKGIRVLSKKYNIPVYATEKTWRGIPELDEIMESSRRHLSLNGQEINGLKIDVFSLSHDALDPVGLCFYEKESIYGYATDTGYITTGIKKYLTGADFLFIEANHDIDLLKTGKYPWHLKRRILSNMGHLSNVDAAMGLTSLISGKTKKVALGHLSKENNTPGIAKQTVERILEEVKIKVDIDIAKRNCPSLLYTETEE